MGTHGHGTVTQFDRDIGLGLITDDDGRTWPFHCIAIADGSRDIETRARVAFDVLPKLGRWEATAIRPG
ncbi:MAG: cold shock domain-containing protein [Ilumatobacteraceae bacterium]